MIPKMLSETQSIKDKIDEIVKKKKDAEAKKKEDDFADEEPETTDDSEKDTADDEPEDTLPDEKDSEEDTEDKPTVDKDMGDYRKSDAEGSDRPSVWSPFAKKIVADMDVYFEKIGEQQPTRVVATKFRNEIEDKLEDGKEKNNVIKFFNTKFKIAGVSTKAWNYFAESVYDPKDFDGTYPQVLDKMEKKYGHIEAWKTMIDGERKRLASGKSIMDMNENDSSEYTVYITHKGRLEKEIFKGDQYDCEAFIRTYPIKEKNRLLGLDKTLAIVTPEGRII